MPIHDKILQRLHDNETTLIKLNLRGFQISDAEAKALTDALLNNTNLTKLYLNRNKISDAGAIALGEVLGKNSTLTELDLEWNQISGVGAKALGEALEKNTTLTELYLGSNKISDAGAIVLAEALEKNTTLTNLSLRSNKISDAGAIALGKALVKNTTLTSLSLENNKISDVGAIAIAEALEKNTTLTNLKLNVISMNVESQINKYIKRNQHYFKELKSTVLMQLRAGRILLRDMSVLNKNNRFLSLPLEVKESLVKVIGENAFITEEQQRLVLNYAEGNILPVADKLSFFKVTKCNKVMKQLNANNQTEEPPTLKTHLG